MTKRMGMKLRKTHGWFGKGVRIFMLSCVAMFGLFVSDGFSGVEGEVSSVVSSPNPETADENPTWRGPGFLEISFKFQRKGIASSQYAIWIEDKTGNLIKTVFVTSFTARGGYTFRKDCLPTWVSKAKPQLNKTEVDAVSGATPPSGKQVYVWDGRDQHGNPVVPGEYRFYLEATLYWSNRVLYSGTFFHGGPSQENIPISISYFGNQKNKDMIQELKARYVSSQL